MAAAAGKRSPADVQTVTSFAITTASLHNFLTYAFSSIFTSLTLNVTPAYTLPVWYHGTFPSCGILFSELFLMKTKQIANELS